MPSASLSFGGEEMLDAPPERVFDLLTDLDQLSATIPDLISAQKTGERTLHCVVRPGFSFLRGTLRVEINLGDVSRPTSAVMHVAAKGIGTQIGVESQIKLDPEQQGTRVHWSAEVIELKGLVATVGRSLISAAAEQVIRSAWQRIRETLAQHPAP